MYPIYVSVAELFSPSGFVKVQSALNSDRLCRPEFFGEPGQRYKSSGFKLSNVKIDNLKILNNKIVQSLKGMNSLFNDDAINEISTTLITGRRMMVNSKGLKVEKKLLYIFPFQLDQP